MVEPTVIPRTGHSISRRDIDSDALKVLYRLHQNHYIAYLVGGSVRDLLLGRPPKDFDIGTSAHPYQVKKLFRNCWVIGRRFRLAHVKFGTKTVEVATFRRHVLTSEDDVTLDGTVGPDGVEIAGTAAAVASPPPTSRPLPVAGGVSTGRVGRPASERWQITDGVLARVDGNGEPSADSADDAVEAARPRRRPTDLLIHRDNTFGTPEEDAFRRDFTVNALFYDIATFSIIDYVGGLDDLEAKLIRSIGDPDQRFQEDPVRMLRAIALAARLQFTIDPPTLTAIERQRAEIALSAPARLLEECYKILRAGHSERAFRELAQVGLLQHLSPELYEGAKEALWESLARLDAYRQRFQSIPESLTNPILLGSLLVPMGFSGRRPSLDADGRFAPLALGSMQLPRRDIEHLRQVLSLQRRLLDAEASTRAHRTLMHRSAFREALTWLEIHGEATHTVQYWRDQLKNEVPVVHAPWDTAVPERRRRRRRRRSTHPA